MPDTDKRSFRTKTHTRQNSKRYTPDDLQDDERNGWDEEISVDGDAEDTYEASDKTPLEGGDGSLQILEKLPANGTTPLKTHSQTLFSTPAITSFKIFSHHSCNDSRVMTADLICC